MSPYLRTSGCVARGLMVSTDLLALRAELYLTMIHLHAKTEPKRWLFESIQWGMMRTWRNITSTRAHTAQSVSRMFQGTNAGDDKMRQRRGVRSHHAQRLSASIEDLWVAQHDALCVISKRVERDPDAAQPDTIEKAQRKLNYMWQEDVDNAENYHDLRQNLRAKKHDLESRLGIRALEVGGKRHTDRPQWHLHIPLDSAARTRTSDEVLPQDLKNSPNSRKGTFISSLRSRLLVKPDTAR